MTAREDAGLDLDALEAVANDVINDEGAPHAFDVFVTDSDEAFWDGVTPEVVLALIARVRATEATIERVRAAHECERPEHDPRAKGCELNVYGVSWAGINCRRCDPGAVLKCSCGQPYPCPTVRALEGSPS